MKVNLLVRDIPNSWYSIKTVILLGETHRSMEPNTELKNRSTLICLTFDKGTKTIQWKRATFSKNGAREMG